jgi:hypothetical protein
MKEMTMKNMFLILALMLTLGLNASAQNQSLNSPSSSETLKMTETPYQDAVMREDVASPETIVSAFFAAGSGPAGRREYARMRALFAERARITTIRRPSGGQPASAVTRSLDEYIEGSKDYNAKNANYERDVRRSVERYANFAHVFCVFEARHSEASEVFYRGVGSFQLLWDGRRWWILNAYWQGDRPEDPLPPRYRDGAEEKVLILEREWLDAYEHRDSVAMERIVADGFTITYPNGIVRNKAQVIEALKWSGDSRTPAPRFKTENVQARVYSGDTTILTGRLITERLVNGKTMIEKSKYTDTYVRLSGQWQVVASHLSRDDQ